MDNSHTASSREALGNEAQSCNLDFLFPRHDPPLRHFDIGRETLLSGLDQLCSYRGVLDRRESLSRHLGVPLVSDILEERISGLFSSRSPCVIEPEAKGHGMRSTSWLEVIRHIDPARLERGDDRTYRCHFQGLLVQIPETDYKMISTGVLQRLVNPWPDVRDLKEELHTVGFVMKQVSEWSQRTIQIVQQSDLLLHSLQERSVELVRNPQLCPRSDDQCSSTVTNADVGRGTPDEIAAQIAVEINPPRDDNSRTNSTDARTMPPAHLPPGRASGPSLKGTVTGETPCQPETNQEKPSFPPVNQASQEGTREDTKKRLRTKYRGKSGSKRKKT